MTEEEKRRIGLVIIGAHDGGKTEPLVKKWLDKGLPCLLIEPVPYLFSRLADRWRQEPRVITENCAISDQAKRSTFFFIPEGRLPGLPRWASELGSFNPAHATNHAHIPAEHVKKTIVACYRIQDVLAKHSVESVEAVVIDAEGHDYDILMAFPFDRFRPSQILFEHRHMDGFMRIGTRFAAAVQHLVAQGYELTILDNENCLADVNLPK